MSGEQQTPKNSKRHWSAVQIFGILATTAAIALGGVTIWQTSSIRALDAQEKNVEKIGLKIDTVREALSALDTKVTSALTENATKINALEKRYDIHEARERR